MNSLVNKCPRCLSFDYQKLTDVQFKCNKCGFIWKFLSNDKTELEKEKIIDDNIILSNDKNKDIKTCIKTEGNLRKDIMPLFKCSIGGKFSMSFRTKYDKVNYDNKCVRKFQIKERKKRLKDKFLINIKFFNIENTIQYPIKYLSGFLNLCLMKYIAEFFDNEKLLNNLSSEMKTIILKLRKNIDFKKDKKDNIQNLLKETEGNNILIYSQYLNIIINSKKINEIINLLNKEKEKKINIFWGCLSNYEEYNTFFEQELTKDLKKTKFDYSIISLGILEQENEYNSKRKSCPNMQKRILYHGSQIAPISNILTTEFKYSRRPFYGMGIYFTDIIDYASFYSGGTNFNNRRDNFGLVTPINSTFSLIACEIFYDKKKFKQINDDSLYIDDLDHFPSYNELKEDYLVKMVEPNGIHFIRVDNEGDALSERNFLNEKKKGEFLGNEYVITEKYQILPIYSLTLKRNEYFILWRDPHFKGKNEYSDFLLERKLFSMEKAKLNIYFEYSTEEALKFILRRKYNKIILITSIGLDLSGKRFIEIARKILGFNVIVLFFSANEDHLKWIQYFPNCLYSNCSDIYEEYITNFNARGLNNLKKKVEKEYNITLKEFSKDFILS